MAELTAAISRRAVADAPADWRAEREARVAAMAAAVARNPTGRGVVDRGGTPVVCVETGERFPSMGRAAAARDGHPSAILAATRTGLGAYGHHWRRADGRGPAPRPARRRPVRCLETGEVYPSVLHAARSVGRRHPAMRQAIRRGTKCGGLRWELVTDAATLAAEMRRIRPTRHGPRPLPDPPTAFVGVPGVELAAAEVAP